MTERRIQDLRAYECYLRATAAFYRLTESAMHDALRDLQQALEIVGENALLCCGMSYAYFWLANIGVAIEENLDKCESWARKALAIDSASTKARALLVFAAAIYRGRRATPDDIRQLKRALQDDPNEPLALLGLSWLYVYAGRISEAAALSQRYAERQPLDTWTYALPIYVSWFDGQYERGLEASWRNLAARPEAPGSLTHMAWSLAWVGRIDEAVTFVDKNVAIAPGHVHSKLGLLVKYGLQGDAASARAELTPEFHDWCFKAPIWSYCVAAAFALANAKDDALEWLEHAVDLGWINYPFLAEKDPFLANIRREPRFQKLMERVKHEWENFEA